jgi:hypothetical protein
MCLGSDFIHQVDSLKNLVWLSFSGRLLINYHRQLKLSIKRSLLPIHEKLYIFIITLSSEKEDGANG